MTPGGDCGNLRKNGRPNNEMTAQTRVVARGELPPALPIARVREETHPSPHARDSDGRTVATRSLPALFARRAWA